MLPCYPLLAERQIWVGCKGELVIWIKVSRQVRQNGRALHDAQASIVMVNEDWNAAVWTFLREPGLFLDVLANVDGLVDVIRLSVRLFQLFEDYACLVSCTQSDSNIISAY